MKARESLLKKEIGRLKVRLDELHEAAHSCDYASLSHAKRNLLGDLDYLIKLNDDYNEYKLGSRKRQEFGSWLKTVRYDANKVYSYDEVKKMCQCERKPGSKDLKRTKALTFKGIFWEN